MSSAPPRPDVHLLVRSVREALASAGDVAATLAHALPPREALLPFAAFSSERYTRRSVHRDDEIEVLLLCWEPGQTTPVHDHGGQLGWLAVVEGMLEVVEYRPSATAGTGPALVAAGHATIAAGSVAAESVSAETIHLVGTSSRRAMSLHVYRAPIERYRVFDVTSGASRWVAP